MGLWTFCELFLCDEMCEICIFAHYETDGSYRIGSFAALSHLLLQTNEGRWGIGFVWQFVSGRKW